MTTELSALKLKRAELQHQIAELEGTRASLYGITVVPQEGPAPNELTNGLNGYGFSSP